MADMTPLQSAMTKVVDGIAEAVRELGYAWIARRPTVPKDNTKGGRR